MWVNPMNKPEFGVLRTRFLQSFIKQRIRNKFKFKLNVVPHKHINCEIGIYRADKHSSSNFTKLEQTGKVIEMFYEVIKYPLFLIKEQG